MRFFLMALMLTAPLMGFEDKVRPILEKNCLECHGGKKVKGKVSTLPPSRCGVYQLGTTCV